MKKSFAFISLLISLMFFPTAFADEYSKTIEVFKRSEVIQPYFTKAYGYAVLPTIGKAGIGVGGAYGKGKVYRQGKATGATTMAQLTIGFQLGGQAFSQIIFFEDESAYKNFVSGSFEFGAQANAIAITSSANAQVGTTGAAAGADDLQANAKYYRGMITFTRGKGGLMYEASIGGQKFDFKPY